MPLAEITVGKVLSTLLSAGIGATVASLATIAAFSNRVVLLEAQMVTPADVKIIIDEVTPWLRDKALIVDSIDRLEMAQKSTEDSVNELKVQQSRIEVEIENVGDNVQSILSHLEDR